MFKEGDFVRIRKNYKGIKQYTNKTYQLIKYHYQDVWIINEKLPGANNRIFSDFIEIDYEYYRRLKILKIKEKINESR